MIRAGQRIDNYTMVNRLGANVFGEVWAARESITERLIRFNLMASQDEYQVNRFVRAISLLSRLNHPAIAAHTGHGFVAHQPYLATEHVQGPTIASLIAYGGRMEEARVLRIATQVADGLDHAWRAAQIIHRTLGPETLVVDVASLEGESEDVRIKIMDFGHALGRRLVDQYDPQLVAEEEAFQQEAQKEEVGTPQTMSPEQVAGKRLTVGSDMYALGVTMYLLLTGKPPFSGSDDEVRAAHLRAAPLDLQQVVPGLNGNTSALVRKLLSKTPDGRFPDWASLRTRLQALSEQIRPRQTRTVTDAQPLPQPQTTTRTTAQLRRPTQTFERTPEGVAIPGTAPDAPQPFVAPPPPRGVAIPQPGASGGGRQALGGGQSGGPSAQPGTAGAGGFSGGHHAAHGDGSGPSVPNDRLLVAMLAERLRGGAQLPPGQPAGHQPAAQVPGPAVDDGLSDEQRAAVWSFLLRSPAISTASVNLPADQPEVTSQSSPTRMAVDRRPLAERPAEGEPEPPAATADPVSESSDASPFPDDDELAPAPSFAHLFVAIQTKERGPDERTNDHLRPTDDRPATDRQGIEREQRQQAAGGQPPAAGQPVAEGETPRNPAHSPYWRQTVEILRVAVIGKVRRDVGSGSGIKRLTMRLKRLVASRESTLQEIGELLATGGFDEAEGLLDKLAVSVGSNGIAGNDAQLCLLRGRLAALRGDFTNALRWGQNAVQQKHPDPLALGLVAVCHLQARRYQVAMAVFDEAATVHRTSPIGPLGQAGILFLAGLASKVDPTLDEAAHRQLSPAVIRLAALSCRANGDAEGELALLRQLLTDSAADWEIKERIQEITTGGASSGSRRGTEMGADGG